MIAVVQLLPASDSYSARTLCRVQDLQRQTLSGRCLCVEIATIFLKKRAIAESNDGERVKARVGAERRAHSDSKSLKSDVAVPNAMRLSFNLLSSGGHSLASASLSPRQRPQMRLPLLQALRVRRCFVVLRRRGDCGWQSLSACEPNAGGLFSAWPCDELDSTSKSQFRRWTLFVISSTISI